MTENSSASNFDNYIADLHENLDHLREIHDVDDRSSAIISDLAQAYSEHPSAMQTGTYIFRLNPTETFPSSVFQQCVYQHCFPVRKIFLHFSDVRVQNLKY